MSDSRSQSVALKVALFATGLAGIVAEFVLSTLATYLAGNAIFQWTIVMSLMLFAMGIGSRASRFFHTRLLDRYILVEFSLSILCSISAVLAYGLSAYTAYVPLVIYLQAFVIGGLIGLEIPLVTRMNQTYEDLRINISAVMEKDYYGALIGGLLFAFFALPYLGLTYTPIVLGGVNFAVAVFLLWRFFYLTQSRKLLVSGCIFSLLVIGGVGVFAKPIIRFGEQVKYKDKIIYARQTKYQKIVMTQWKSYYWLYINGQEQFSTYDEEKYHEPLVHPAMQLSPDTGNVLILGGGDGLALREVLKYGSVRSVTLVDLDPAMTDLARNHPVLRAINNGAFLDPRLTVANMDAAAFLQQDANLYGVVIVDLPDPDSIDIMHAYSELFYRNVRAHLIRGGVMVTQATSPYFAKEAFLCIYKTIKYAGLATLPYHNQIPTMGEWGWIIGVNRPEMSDEALKTIVDRLQFQTVSTRFINQDAMISMTHFGKGVLDAPSLARIEINTELQPALYRYYSNGAWGVY